MNIFFAQPSFLKRSISFLLMTSFLNVTLTCAAEPVNAALPPSNPEKAARIKQLQALTLEELQQIRIIPQPAENPSSNISSLKKLNCSQKNQDNACK